MESHTATANLISNMSTAMAVDHATIYSLTANIQTLPSQLAQTRALFATYQVQFFNSLATISKGGRGG